MPPVVTSQSGEITFQLQNLVKKDPHDILRLFRLNIFQQWFSTLSNNVLLAMYGTDKRPHFDFQVVKLIVDDTYDGVAETYRDSQTSKIIRISFKYIQGQYLSSQDDDAVWYEIQGVLTHELVHVYQYNGKGTAIHGWIEGYADFIRLRLALPALGWQKRRGGSFEDGYSTSAYFLDWLDRSAAANAGICASINVYLQSSEWDSDVIFLRFAKKSLSQLWKAYQDEIF